MKVDYKVLTVGILFFEYGCFKFGEFWARHN